MASSTVQIIRGKGGATFPEKQVPLRGVPSSGRRWKQARTERFSAIRKDKPLRTTFKDKVNKKHEFKSVKSYENELKMTKKQEKIDHWNRVKENKERREANARKAEVVQVIKNTKKLKRIKKKQLRKIEKRDTSDVKTVKM